MRMSLKWLVQLEELLQLWLVRTIIAFRVRPTHIRHYCEVRPPFDTVPCKNGSPWIADWKIHWLLVPVYKEVGIGTVQKSVYF